MADPPRPISVYPVCGIREPAGRFLSALVRSMEETAKAVETNAISPAAGYLEMRGLMVAARTAIDEFEAGHG